MFTRSLILGLCSALILSACTPTAEEDSKNYTATVNSVHDGDTVRVTDRHGTQHRIRMAFIDAPETKQAYGIASRDALRQRLERQTVKVEVLDTDQYQREVARIMLNGEDINLAQIQNGNAWLYRSIARKSQNKADFQRYENAEEQAKKNRLGLWKQRNPEAPWDYRKQRRQQSANNKAANDNEE